MPISKLVKSAIANAVNNFDLSEDNLYIKEIKVDEGPTLKRWMPRAHGRATPLRKRTSHVYVTLGEIKDSGEKEDGQEGCRNGHRDDRRGAPAEEVDRRQYAGDQCKHHPAHRLLFHEQFLFLFSHN